jgi:hypothetical protein
MEARLKAVLTLCVSLLVSLAAVVSPGHAQPIFVNGLALSGDLQDKSHDAKFRVGYFSDIYYDPNRNELWGLSDRGPGGGVLSYGTRVQRFTVDIHPVTGAISKFRIVETVEFKNKLGDPLDGIAPGSALDASNLGNSFDPEGLVVHPVTGNLLVSDEYGPSLYEFRRDGTLVRAFKTPENLKPTNADGSYNFDVDGGATGTGRRTNRGFEGLAISPDGAFVYAMLQSAMVNEGGGDGFCNRIVKFDTATGNAVAQFAYQMDTAGQGRGISALVAVNADEFLVLERNNRGIGVGAAATPPDKDVYRISLVGAIDVSDPPLTLSNTTCPSVAVAKNPTPFLNLAANTLPELGNRVPEKWEGLAIGPRLSNGSYLVLAGTDNDYSVTQNGSGTQFDVYFDFAAALADPAYDAFANSIQCPIGKKQGCVFTTGGAPAKLTRDHGLLPGVLHSYRVTPADLGPYEPPVQP